MIHIRAKVLGVLIAVLALGVAVAAPGFAAAEGEVAPEAPPAAEAMSEASLSLGVKPFAEESCEGGTVCAWPNANFAGQRFERACTGIGTVYRAGFIVGSLKNRCGNPVKALGDFTHECIPSVANDPSTGVFSEFRIVASC
jgi:hypothetical protein